jgi:hypothetical protein
LAAYYNQRPSPPFLSATTRRGLAAWTLLLGAGCRPRPMGVSPRDWGERGAGRARRVGKLWPARPTRGGGGRPDGRVGSGARGAVLATCAPTPTRPPSRVARAGATASVARGSRWVARARASKISAPESCAPCVAVEGDGGTASCWHWQAARQGRREVLTLTFVVRASVSPCPCFFVTF